MNFILHVNDVYQEIKAPTHTGKYGFHPEIPVHLRILKNRSKGQSTH